MGQLLVINFVYVKDLLCIGKGKKQMGLVEEQICSRIKVHVCDIKSKVLGMVIEDVDNVIFVHKSRVVEKLLLHFGIKNVTWYPSPYRVDAGHKRSVPSHRCEVIS